MNKKLLGTVIGIVLITAGIITFLVVHKQSVFTGDRIKNPDCYKITFETMNMEDSHSLELKEGDVLNIMYDITKGQMDLTVGMEGEEPVYRGNDMDKGNFDVTILKSGTYKILVDADHAGGYLYIKVK